MRQNLTVSTMALGAFKQIPSSTAVGFHRRCCHGVAPWDKIVCSEIGPSKNRKESSPSSSSSSSSISGPLGGVKRHPTQFASSQVGCAAAILYAEPQIDASILSARISEMENYVDEDDILTELQRSLLECQWLCTDESQPTTVRRLNRPSARQRRMTAKQSRKSVQLEKLQVSSSKRLNDLRSSIAESIETVNTVGLMKATGKRGLLSREEELILSKKMKVGQNLRAARKKLTKILGHEPSDEMWARSVKLSFTEMQKKLREADRARDYMFLCNLRLVVSVANKYSTLGISLVDLIQEGAVGLLRGLEKFDYRRGFKLSTYVHWWIRQGVTRALSKHSKTVRVPAYMHGRMNVLNRMMAKFKMNGKHVSVETLSDALNMSDETVAVALKATKKTSSLDKMKRWGNFNPDKDTMHNYVADPSIENNPWHMVDKMSLREDVEALLMSTLSEREQDIIRLYYGFDCADGQGISFEKIGQRIGISRERVRQVEGCALRKLVIAGRQVGMGIPLIE